MGVWASHNSIPSWRENSKRMAAPFIQSSRKPSVTCSITVYLVSSSQGQQKHWVQKNLTFLGNAATLLWSRYRKSDTTSCHQVLAQPRCGWHTALPPLQCRLRLSEQGNAPRCILLASDCLLGLRRGNLPKPRGVPLSSLVPDGWYCSSPCSLLPHRRERIIDET